MAGRAESVAMAERGEHSRASDARDHARRQRSRIACEPCRLRKRRCDGGKPCSLCVSFAYECHYRTQPRRRRVTAGRIHNSHSASPPNHAAGVARDSEDSSTLGDAGLFMRSLESNSGSAFVRSFALSVDPANKSAPAFGTLQMLAWNLYLGERQLILRLPLRGIRESLSFNDMRELADIYFDKLDPCYGFLERDRFEANLNERWLIRSEVTVSLYDAVLCGIAAIGCLFSSLQDLETEVSLVSHAKSLLDLVVYEPPSVDSAVAWVLRTVYLRLTAKPHEAWMSSCTALHHIDATGLHRESSLNTVFQPAARACDLDTRRRIFGVARHLNAWLSFDLARSRIVLQNASYTLPANRPPKDYTCELLELLPYTENLDPSKSISGDALVHAFSEVLGRTHSQPPSILAQCNLMLCLYRRLYTLKWKVPQETLAQAVAVIERGLQAVRTTIENSSPWHHVANVPFQSICTLLAIDTAQSFSLLSSAISCLDMVNERYQTQATKDALSAAYALTFMHQKRREADLRRQSDLLKLYPTSTQPTHDERLDNFPISQAFTDLPWFTDLMPDIDLDNFDDIFAI